MRDLVRGAIDRAQGENDAAHLEDSERRLRQLSAFLPDDERDSPLAGGVTHTSMSPLAKLCAWQQALDVVPDAQHAVLQGIHPVLLPDTLALVDSCAALCRASNGSLDYFCNSGLARNLWQLRGITRFCGSEALARTCDSLDDDCLDMHLCGARPPAAALQQWLARLFGAVFGAEYGVPATAEPDIAAMPELPFRDVYDRELARYREQLQAELQMQLDAAPNAERHAQHENVGDLSATALQTTRAESAALKVSPLLITLLYKLTWVFAAAEQHDWSRLCRCAYRVALQHWRIRLPMNDALQRVLADLAQKPGAPLPATVLRQWRTQLLQDWPRWTDDTQRPIALRHDAGDVVALDAVPDLLSGSFTTLVQAGRLAQNTSARDCARQYQVLVQDLAPELLQELALLEKGAAAMKVWPLEQLCTLLIAVYESHLRDDTELPAMLLQDAHRQLVRMLDQAAAWREVQLAPILVQALEAWLRESAAMRATLYSELYRESYRESYHESYHEQCREPGATPLVKEVAHGDGIQSLRAQLLSFLGTLAPVLERPVRLQLDAAESAIDAARLAQLLDCLRPLIKFMLLDQSVDTRMRHAMHKPRVSTLSVSLRATSATLVVTVGEDSHEDVLAANELQRLQRRLPKTAGALACESRAGHGRSFTFTLGGNNGA
ncbi:MAG: hypothetical protein SV422_01505, partial [Pseudomonadota bacterium]|nr:hypothetical protein [Pseudomonadota bacterium]